MRLAITWIGPIAVVASIIGVIPIPWISQPGIVRWIVCTAPERIIIRITAPPPVPRIVRSTPVVRWIVITKKEPMPGVVVVIIIVVGAADVCRIITVLVLFICILRYSPVL
jgi:hypothetical protein